MKHNVTFHRGLLDSPWIGLLTSYLSVCNSPTQHSHIVLGSSHLPALCAPILLPQGLQKLSLPETLFPKLWMWPLFLRLRQALPDHSPYGSPLARTPPLAHPSVFLHSSDHLLVTWLSPHCVPERTGSSSFLLTAASSVPRRGAAL